MARRNQGVKAHRVVRDATVADHPVVLSMNNAATPEVNALARHEFDWLVSHATYFRVVEDAEGVAGFLLCLASGLDYWSENYKWFTARHASFLYVDRVVVAERARGSGAGRALYEDLHAFALGKWPRITSEVNIRPPNPASIAFHERLGYAAVGVREYADGVNAVRMFHKQM
jgi:predicted GNAT superfamily acetyltransferase